MKEDVGRVIWMIIVYHSYSQYMHIHDSSVFQSPAHSHKPAGFC